MTSPSPAAPSGTDTPPSGLRTTPPQSTVLHNHWVLALGWVLAHLIPVVWINRYGTSTGDVHYYFVGVNHFFPDTMTEYPVIGALPAHLVNLLPGGEDAYINWFIALCVATSAVFTAWLVYMDSSPSHRAAWFWIMFIGLSGPIVLTRLDLFPSLTVAAFAALLFARTRAARRAAAIVLAVATMMKLWPGVLGAALVGGFRRRSTWARIGWFFGSLVVICLLIAAVSGVDALTTPLNYQSDRGLQIESLAATPVMLAASFAAVGDTRWSISYAASKSFEIIGPGAGIMTTVATVATAAMVLFALGWAVTRLIRDDWSPMQALSFSLTMVALIIATNKVFSPQYITWLAPSVAVALLVSRRRIVAVLAVEVLVTALLTTFVYPVYYDWLMVVPTATQAVVILALRNVGILVIAGTALWWAVTAAREDVTAFPVTSGRRGSSRR
ncbi:glycosyltransferase 87 family protein [Corynebacterium terpenotabidum]|uniref:glycosyltransferase 87 family protein n=1 Tax=Corynebacterium terpenotabidum TaxID=89154 RepID=UPI0003F9F2A3|nr:glycosyltransferase 87 family protein [Corynebacterium terpenotabidum]